MPSELTTSDIRVLQATIDGVKSDVGEMRMELASVRRAMEALVRMEEQQSSIKTALGRAFDEIKEERVKREATEARLRLLEVDAPSYRELRRWVIGGVLTGIAMMAAALFKIIIGDPLERAYVVRPVAPLIVPQNALPGKP